MLGHDAISENPVSAISVEAQDVEIVQVVDVLDASDRIVKQVVIRLGDKQDVADAFTQQQYGVVLNTVAPAERQDASDALHALHHRIFADNFSLIDTTVSERTVLQSVIAQDMLDVRDDFAKLRSARISEAQYPISDVASLQGFFEPRTITQPASDQIDVQDAVFLQHLMRDIRATDAIQFAEMVLLSMVTRDLRFSDNVHLSDEALLQQFGPEFEALLAGIRTFTCTPGYDLQREAITKTAVADFDQPGLFSATNGAARPSYRFVVNISALTRIQVQSLQAFHFFHQGGKAFYIDGFTAWSSVTTLNLVGEGNGTKKDFFLPNRNIDPNSITVAVFDGATHSITTAYSLNAGPGIVSFNTAPSSGHDIEAAHGHKYKVVFEPDGIKIDEFAQGVFRAQLKLRELAV